MNSRFHLLFILALIAPLSVFCQSSDLEKRKALVKNYSIEHGLPSNEVYQTIQDDKGYMWFCTDRGIVQFDGSIFKTYDKSHGLPDNVVVSGRKDSKGKLWFLSLNDDIFTFSGKIQTFGIKELLDSNGIDIHDIKIRDFYNDKADTLHILSSKAWKKTYYIKVSPDRKVIAQEITDTKVSFLYKKFDENNYIHCVNLGYKGTDSHTEKTLAYGLIGFGTPYHNNYVSSINGLFEVWKSAFAVNNNHIFYTLQNELFLGNSNEPSFEFNTRVHGLSYINKNLYICTNSGLFQLNHSENWQKQFFVKNSVSHFFIDAFNNMWISTTTAGLKFISNSPFTVLTEDPRNNKRNSCYLETKERFFVGRKDGTLLIFNKTRTAIDTTITVLNNHNPIDFLLKLGPDSILIHQSGIPHLLCISTLKVFPLINGFSPNISVATNKNTYAGLKYSYGGISIYNKKFNILYRSGDPKNNVLDFNKKSFCLYNDSINSRLLIGSFDGVYSFNLKNYTFPDEELFPELKNKSISAISPHKSAFAFGTKGSGIYVSTNSANGFWINRENGLQNLNINTLLFYNEQTIIAGTNNSLYVIKLGGNNPKVSFYNQNNGLFGNEVLKIERHSNSEIKILTDQGLLSCSINDLLNKPSAPTFFEGFLLDNKLIVEDSLVTEYNNSTVIASFASLGFSSFGSKKYAYKILPLNNDWIITQEPKINLTGLRPNSYEIHFTSVENENDAENSKAVVVHYAILKPFYFTTAFIIITIIISVFFVALIAQFVINRIRLQAETKNQLIELEHTALQSQMNPHFLFNTLNSIQSYIAANEKIKAYEYISRFAQIVRVFLEKSNKKVVSLSEELKTLESYIILEQMRFNNQFSFKINIDDNIKNESDVLLIPSMILQPIIENSIIHGLRQKLENGLLTINILDLEYGYGVEIIDNGIGRIDAQKTARIRKNHTSMGLSNIQRRIELLNSQVKDKIHFEVFDLKLEDNAETGTKTVFKFPYSIYEK